MSNKSILLIELQYLPSIQWVNCIWQYDHILFDIKENYVKGSYRNRCHILGPNGIHRLSVPLVKGKNQHTPMEKVRISYEERWQKDHWQTLCSNYRSSAFFEYFEDSFLPIYTKKYDYLIELNYALIELIFKILKLKKDIQFTSTYIHPFETGYVDYRSIISPKLPTSQFQNTQPYTQVFSDRFPFQNNLSIFDLICNTGNKHNSYETTT